MEGLFGVEHETVEVRRWRGRSYVVGMRRRSDEVVCGWMFAEDLSCRASNEDRQHLCKKENCKWGREAVLDAGDEVAID
jgi:hypothetical protein